MEKNCFGPKKKTSSSDAQPSSPLVDRKAALPRHRAPQVASDPVPGRADIWAGLSLRGGIMDLLDTIANKFHKVRGRMDLMDG